MNVDTQEMAAIRQDLARIRGGMCDLADVLGQLVESFTGQPRPEPAPVRLAEVIDFPAAGARK